MRTALNRRHFIFAATAVGGGMVLGFAPAAGEPGAGAVELTPWLTIGGDGAVTVRVTTPDVGNGVATNAAALVAEELGCDWATVRTEYASPARDAADHAYSEAGGAVAWFSGRSTLPDRMTMMLQAGASARERLKAAAATRWSVPIDGVTVEQGVLWHRATGRSLRFSEVAGEAARISLAIEPKLKPASEWVLLGKPLKRLEQATIVEGKATYGIDVHVPNMVYAALRQSPVQGGRLKSMDAAKVRGMPGVLAVVVVDPDEPRGAPANGKEPMAFPAFTSAPQSAVAVIAQHYWQAKTALEALPVEWDDGAGAMWKDNAQAYSAANDQLGIAVEKATLAKGSVDGAASGKFVEATYRTPYCDHAPMEPLNGVALVSDTSVEIWQPTQNIEQSVWVAADEARVPLTNVIHHQPLVGGAFGRRTLADDTRMVVAVARKFKGRPVKLIWSREESMRQGRYRPLATAKLSATLDAGGQPTALTARIVQARGFFPLGLIDSPYLVAGIPNVRVESQLLEMHLLTGSFRGPSYNSYAFMLESFIDECAVTAGIDPVEYRVQLLAGWPDQGWVGCLKLVAKHANLGKPLPQGEGQGIALSNWGGYGKPHKGTTAAVVAHVSVSKAGELKVRSLDLAFDSGKILNADVVSQQLTGAALFGLNVAMNEEITLENGRVVEGNFDQYPIFRTGDVPKIAIHFDALTGDSRYGEIGEVGVGPVGAAVANAVFRATGKRMRTQPFRTHDLSWS